MAEYIERNDAKRTLWTRLMVECFSKRVFDIFMDDFAKIPAADVRENVRGEWIKQSTFWTCSECEKNIRVTTDGIDNFDEDPVFCPYCGADIRGDEYDT